MVNVTVTLLSAGYCLQDQGVALRGRAHQQVRFPAMFALIEHPSAGAILYDTGYAPRFYDETRRLPYRLYAMITPATIQPEETAAAQLQVRGIASDDVHTIIVSHFHADHVAGLRDFPNATLIYFAEGYAAIREKTGLSAVRAAFVPALLPDQLEARSKPISLASAVDLGDTLLPFTHGVDLFDDGSVIGVHLPGHAYGQMGLLLCVNDKPVFLIADACWHSDTYRLHMLPSWLGRVVQADTRMYLHTIAQLHALHQRQPALPMLPSHCQDVYAQIVQAQGGALDVR